MPWKRWIFRGALLAGTAVLLGAYGAHGLTSHLERQGHSAAEVHQRSARYDTAVRYQMFQSLGLLAIAVILRGAPDARLLAVAAWALLLGVLIFSGLLYVLAVAGPAWRWLGAIVPIGGLSMAAGWFALAAWGLLGGKGQRDEKDKGT